MLVLCVTFTAAKILTLSQLFRSIELLKSGLEICKGCVCYSADLSAD
jgi:hypothetical protein